VPVAHHEILTGRHCRRADGSAYGRPDGPLLIEWLAVHVDRIAFGGQMIARQSDDPLHQIGDGVPAVLRNIWRSLEDHNVPNVDRAEFDAQFVDNDSIPFPQSWVHRT